MIKIFQAALLALCILLTGCSSTLKVTETNASGRFPTDTKLVTGGVKKIKPFDQKYKALLYVKTDAKSVKYNDFFETSFSNMHVFSRVEGKQKLESYVLEKKLADKVTNISDLIGLNQLQKQIGPFLVVEPYIERIQGYHFMGQLKVIDPETGEVVLLLEQKAFNWSGLDGPLFYPLLNAFLEWTKGEEIKTARSQDN